MCVFVSLILSVLMKSGVCDACSVPFKGNGGIRSFFFTVSVNVFCVSVRY